MGREKPAQIVCWKCRKGDVTLRAVPNEDGTKDRPDRRDYVCVDCYPLYPRPPVGNCSHIYFKPPVTAEKQTVLGQAMVNG